MNNFGKNLALWIVIGLLLVALFNLFQTSSSRGPQATLAFSDFLNDVNRGQVADVTIQGNNISGHFTDSRAFTTYAPNDPNLVSRLTDKGVRITAAPVDENVPSLFGVLISWFPMLLLIGVWIFFMRQMQGGGGRAMGFGKSRARLLTEKVGRITFEDVAGIDEAKQELEEIVEYLKDPQKFQRLGGKIPKGVLLVGPPGTGKTLLARAIAGEANVPFFTISGSDFVEMFVGVGASRVRDMFEQGKKNAPCIIFIDEIDAVGRHRGAGLGGGNDEREQTLNQLLVEMDGFEANEGVILIAATNRPDVLDPALLRPGPVRPPSRRAEPGRRRPREDPQSPHAQGAARLGRRSEDHRARHARLLRRRSRQSRQRGGADGGAQRQALGRDERVRARQGQGHDGRRAALDGDDRGREEADRLSRGRPCAVHALCRGHEPLHKVTIIPRGRALGVTMFLPERDKYSQSKLEIKAMLASLFGGRVAEELIFGPDKVTTGAADDIRRATGLARRMVTEFGFSEKLGPLRYAENEEEVFLGHSVTQRKNVSEATAKVIDEEIRRIVDEGEQTARDILTARLDELHALAKGLLEYETLSADEIRRIIKGERIVRETSDRSGDRRAAPGKAQLGAARRPADRPRTRAAARAADGSVESNSPRSVERVSDS